MSLCVNNSRTVSPLSGAPEDRENAGVRRPFAVCIVRAMLSCIDSDPLQESMLPSHKRPSFGLDWQAWGTLARGEAPTLALIMRHNDEGRR